MKWDIAMKVWGVNCKYMFKSKFYFYIYRYFIYMSKEINNQCVLSQFGEIRRRCGKRCFKGHPCSVCEKIIRTAELLEQLEIAVTPQATVDDL